VKTISVAYAVMVTSHPLM